MHKRHLQMKYWLSVIFIVLLTATVSHSARDSYMLGPNDVINVSIYAGGVEQVAVDLTISAQGNVNFPFIGTIEAVGITSSDLEHKVLEPLERDYFVDPQVHIRIKEFHSLHFSISGAVKRPGKYEMQSATTIMDLIAKAEGVTLESGNIAYVMRYDSRVGRQGGATTAESGKEEDQIEPIKVNLVKLLDEGDMSFNMPLVSGDSVYIPYAKGLNQTESKVYVSGEVERPALYEYQPGLTALSVCIMAGGFAKYAAPNRTTVIRTENGEQKVIKIDLEDVIKGKKPDIPLQPGDRVHVPESWL